MDKYVISESYGVVIGFRNERDRERYVFDPLTSGFECCTPERADKFMRANDLVWELPRTFYGGTLDGLEVRFSRPREAA